MYIKKNVIILLYIIYNNYDSRSKRPAWWTKEIESLRKKKLQSRRRASKAKGKRDAAKREEEYRTISKLYQDAVRTSRANFSKQEENRDDDGEDDDEEEEEDEDCDNDHEDEEDDDNEDECDYSKGDDPCTTRSNPSSKSKFFDFLRKTNS